MSELSEMTLRHHAMLVAWGQYAQCIGLIQAIETILLHQKAVTHRPQTKVLEFLVAILAGFEYLKDISLSAHPLDRDAVAARAWGQPGWADHSGVSRTLTSLSATEAQQIVLALESVSQPLIDKEVVSAWTTGRLELDADLSPRPVSDTSRTYPDAAFGHMSDHIGLGYQAAVVSMTSITYGRLGLSVVQHPGNTVSCTQAEALVLAAERRISHRPWRRTDLLAQRIGDMQPARAELTQKVTAAQERLTQAQTALTEVQHRVADGQQQVQTLQTAYTQRDRPERPHSQLAQAKAQLTVKQDRQRRREGGVARAESWLTRCQAGLSAHDAEIARLTQRLQRFETDNATNAAPLVASLRLDAGFETPENVALSIELGYEVYGKPFGTWLLPWLQTRVTPQGQWRRVGHNAEMLAWPAVQLADFPYPLDLALEHFQTGNEIRTAALLHFGQDDVTADLPHWFHYYNARQTIEAGHKESKGVFEVRHLKVRNQPALMLQEQGALFAANFVRFAAQWLAEQCPQLPDGWKDSAHPKVKQQVRVGAHTTAWVTWLDQGCLLRFETFSVYAGRSLTISRTWVYQPVLPFAKSSLFEPV
jgi:hypothetical protein